MFADSNPRSGAVFLYAVVADGISDLVGLLVRQNRVDTSHRPKCFRGKAAAFDSNFGFSDRCFGGIRFVLTRGCQ